MEVTLKHELVHQILYKNNSKEYRESDDKDNDGIKESEEGDQFEIAVWGIDINSYETARQARLMARNISLYVLIL